MRERRTKGMIVAAAMSVIAGSVARAQVDGTWMGPAGGSWTVGGNWTSNPDFPSAGGTATFADSGTQSVSLGAGTLLLGALHFDSEGQIDVTATTASANIKFTGPGLIDVPVYKRNKPGVAPYYLGHSIAPQIAFDSGAVNVVGTPGGASAVYYNPLATAGFSGDLSITNAAYTTSSTYGLGVGSHSATLDGATLRFNGNSGLFTSRSMILGAGGATFEFLTLGGYAGINISGTGPLTLAAGQMQLFSSSTYTGATRIIGGGTVALQLGTNGRLINTSSISVSGALNLFPTSNNPGQDLINDNELALRGGTLALGQNGSDYNEHTGTLSLRGGLNTVRFQADGQPLSLTATTLARQDRALLRMMSGGVQLGGGTSTGAVHLKFDDGGASLPLVGGGGAPGTPSVSIIPFAYLDVFPPANAPAGFLTYDANGLRPLAASESDTTMPAVPISTDNVRTNANITLAGPQTINSLFSTANSANVTGSGTLTVTSGAIFGVHNFVPLDFGAAEGVFTNGGVHAPISGSNGVTYTSTATVAGASLSIDAGVQSTYTGLTTINAGTIAIRSDALPGVPGAFGADSSPVVLMGRTVGATIANPDTTSLVTFGRDLIVKSDPELYNANAPTLRGFMNVTGNVTLEGPLGIEPAVALAGNISGPGRLFAVGTFGSGSAIFLGGNNTFTGGVDLGTGTWTAGSDTAFGTGTVYVGDGPGGGTAAFIRSAAAVVGAPSRTFANPFLLFDDVTFAIQQPQTMTLNGPVDLNGEARTIRVNGGFPAPNLASLIINGNITGGDLRINGVVQVSGDNSQWSTRIDQGRLRVVSNHGLGLAPKFTQIGAGTNIGANIAELDLVGGVTIPAHPLVFVGPGLPILKGTGGGNNTWLGQAQVNGNGTFMVDAGASLTIAGGITANVGTSTLARVVIVGPGTLNTAFLRTDNPVNTFLNATMRLIPNGTDAGTSKVGSFTMAGGINNWAGRLDLTDNALVYDYPLHQTPISEVGNMIKNGYNGGSWNGNGIVSSFAAASIGSAHPTAVGYIDNNFTPLPATFRGQPIDDSALIVAYTYAGDANLDSTVDLTDFTIFASNFNHTVNGWWQGDFNYDGKVDLTDFTLLATNFNQTLIAGGGSPGSIGATVPEPTTALTLVGAVTLLTHRRRRTARRIW